MQYDPDDRKLKIVLECMEIDNPRIIKDYIANLMTWEIAELQAYLEKRKLDMKSHGDSRFRPHP
ncbi:hypothetical protein CUJ83_01690 [Methanocella sp. CWC-04]|uniref:Uncharacterized protein n=1 Tax=Methanooceanicella nereidis TaxID=2052831 RepID=A0AAP2RAZ6_9EURY|nr:hypothetical protein [Methanocella sp. CWC-04]MCD1293707.1 hypothetical protein [Methanocella sp. CWC-04]